MAVNLSELKEKLVAKNYDPLKVGKFIAYISGETSKNKNTVLRHSQADLYNLFVKYYNVGTNLDGVNVVLTGQNMGLITFHGFMNKVKSVHPEVFFDVQLIRGDDTFSFSKESGSVVYSHQIKNPFGDDEIKGAYCVVKLNNENKDESLELLNQRDFFEMKKSSRMSRTWDNWPTEFWRKSVIKRACKIYFSEEISELEKIDNEDYGLEDEKATDEQKEAILKAHAKSSTEV